MCFFRVSGRCVAFIVIGQYNLLSCVICGDSGRFVATKKARDFLRACRVVVVLSYARERRISCNTSIMVFLLQPGAKFFGLILWRIFADTVRGQIVRSEERI